MFKLKSEAYDYLIHFLWSSDDKDHVNVASAIENIKHAMERHEQDVSSVLAYLDEVIDPENDCSLTFKQELAIIRSNIAGQNFELATPTEKFENPFRRHFDSVIAINLLLKPTELMMATVNEISANIIRSLSAYDRLPERSKTKINTFLDSLVNFAGQTPYQAAISFGSFKERPSITQVIEILKEGEKFQLPEIMHIHFKFALNAARYIPTRPSELREPVGKFKTLVEAFEPEGCLAYFIKLASHNVGPADDEYRSYLTNKVIYSSPLYTATPRRGKMGELDYSKETTTLGLMLERQMSYEIDFPTLPLPWVADAKAQAPDLSSIVTLDLIENNAIYVAGPSGMASLFFHLLENMGNFSTIQQKQSYLAAICAYIVGGGFHSFHEVLGPAAYSLDLIPGYEVTIPTVGQKGTPPNFSRFLEIVSEHDLEFKNLIKTAWDQHLRFLGELPIIQNQPKLDKQKATLFMLLDKYPIDSASKEVLFRDDSYAFNFYIQHGYIELLKWLNENRQEQLEHTLVANGYSNLANCASFPSIEVLTWLEETYPDQLRGMVNSDQYYFFIFSILVSGADPLVLTEISSTLQAIDPERFKLAVYHNLSDMPQYAVEFNTPNILEWLEKTFPGSLFEALKNTRTQAFINATIAEAGADLPPAIQYILSLPDCLAYFDAARKEKREAHPSLSRGPSFFAPPGELQEEAPSEEQAHSTTPAKK
jgi:hypothetical protein